MAKHQIKGEALGGELHAVTFDYGQRHKREIGCAAEVAGLAEAQWHLLAVPTLAAIGDSALIPDDEQKLGEAHRGNAALPASFVPGRNLLLLTLAAALAYKLNCQNIWTGVSEQDYSGYPDCRAETITALEHTLRLGLDWPALHLHAPLLHTSKVKEVLFMKRLGLLGWFGHTHTCYRGEFPPCGACDSCKLRAKAFEEAGVRDPLLESR
jgi:7-cyano-7-deazaguanine synthase